MSAISDCLPNTFLTQLTDEQKTKIIGNYKNTHKFKYPDIILQIMHIKAKYKQALTYNCVAVENKGKIIYDET